MSADNIKSFRPSPELQRLQDAEAALSAMADSGALAMLAPAEADAQLALMEAELQAARELVPPAELQRHAVARGQRPATSGSHARVELVLSKLIGLAMAGVEPAASLVASATDRTLAAWAVDLAARPALPAWLDPQPAPAATAPARQRPKLRLVSNHG